MNAPLRLDLPTTKGFYMPPEWATHAGCWMAWPCRDAAYRGFIREARLAYAAVAHAIADFEPVTVITCPEDEQGAKKTLSTDITVLSLPIDDAWLRDSGPTFVVNNNGGVAGIDWAFNAWGRKYPPWDNDDAVAGALLRHLNLPRFLAPFVLEGGSFHTNGDGVLLTTKQCLLHKNRNPRLNKDDITQLLCAYLGVDAVIWLAGDWRDDETDGHIDNIACFSAANRVLLMVDDNTADLRTNHEHLANAVDKHGKPFIITPLPRPTIHENGKDLVASYINFYIANGGIVMPSFGLAEDDKARAIITDEFPDRRIVQVPTLNIIRGGGGIHCITQQQPA